MGYNEPSGIYKNPYDEDVVECTECGREVVVDDTEIVNKEHYCIDCFKELFHECKDCSKIISIELERCEDCQADKDYLESAVGLFDELGYSLSRNNDEELVYSESLETSVCNHISFDKVNKTYQCYSNQYTCVDVNVKLHIAITQQMKELGWL